jgi:hypothetical protein
LSECSCEEINSTLTLLIESKFHILKLQFKDLKSSFEEIVKLNRQVTDKIYYYMFAFLGLIFIYILIVKK